MGERPIPNAAAAGVCLAWRGAVVVPAHAQNTRMQNHTRHATRTTQERCRRKLAARVELTREEREFMFNWNLFLHMNPVVADLQARMMRIASINCIHFSSLTDWVEFV